MRDLRYLLAYLVPLTAATGIFLKGPWVWTTVVFVFALVPVLESILPQSTQNTAPDEEKTRSGRLIFDLLLYANVPIVFGLCFAAFSVLSSVPLAMSEYIGIILSVGIVAGANGINVAHELGHRNTALEQNLAKLLLLPSLYQHFIIEHNRGHHKHVATDADPASARYGEWLFAFWVRSVYGSWRNAWRLERERLQRLGQTAWNLENMMLRFAAYQLLWLMAVGLFFDWKTLAAAIAIAVIGFLLLETVNYVEHYGLRRRLLPSGRYESVSPAHSWNSNHEMGRIMLYELTRHSDHHYKATRKYQILRHMDESPQLPLGYPGSILLALIPPVWFALMNPRVKNLHTNESSYR